MRFVHEALIDNWTRLRDWVRADERFLIWREGLRNDTLRWMRSGRDDSLLLHGSALEEAEEQVPARGAELTEDERRYLAASTNSRIRRRRRSRTVIAIISGLIVLALVIGVAAEAQRRRAEQEKANAASQTLAVDVGSRSELDEELVLHAVAAYRTAPTQRATEALFDVYARTRELDALISPGGVLASDVGEPKVSSDLSRVGVVAGLRVHMWNITEEGAEEAPLTGEIANEIAISADGNTIALLTDELVTLHDAQGRHLGDVDVPDGGVVESPSAIALSPSGGYLAVHELRSSEKITVYDTQTGEEVAREPIANEEGDDDGTFLLSDDALFVSSPFVGSPEEVLVHALPEGPTETIDFPGFDLDPQENHLSTTVTAGTEEPVHASCRLAADGGWARIHTRQPAIGGSEELVTAPINCDETFIPNENGRYAIGQQGENADERQLRFVDLRGEGLVGGSPVPISAEQHAVAPADAQALRVFSWDEEMTGLG